MMKQRHILIIGILSLGLSLALLVGFTALSGARAKAQGDRVAAQGAATRQDALEQEVPLGSAFTYQGQLTDNGEPATGPCDFRFALYDAASDGSQIGSTQTRTDVELSDGRFAVNLDFGSGAFDGEARWLESAVQCIEDAEYTTLAPRHTLSAAPYALYALDTPGYAGVVTVAKSGGDFTSVQTAIEEIREANPENPYLVWVAPGVYSETVTLKPYVHLQGAGAEATVIVSAISNAGWPPTQATLVLTRHVSVRDLTAVNIGGGVMNVALFAGEGVFQALVEDVTARAVGSGSVNYAVRLSGDGTDITLQDVTAQAENGSEGRGLGMWGGAAATLRGGFFAAHGGVEAYGIDIYGTGSTLVAEGVDVLAESEGMKTGLVSSQYASVTLHGGSITARGGGDSTGIDAMMGELVIDSVAVLSESDTGESIGLRNYDDVAVLHGGTYIARAGSQPGTGIVNGGSSSTLEANGITATAHSITDTFGLWNFNDATANVMYGVLEGATESVRLASGNVTLSHDVLVGGAVTGAVTCVAVSRGTTFNANGCP
jgi:pectin methylesterase-like acyl-CoA thioesterase